MRFCAQTHLNPSVFYLQHSYREVGILLLYLAVGVSVFSGIAYTAEYEEVKFDWRVVAGLSHWWKSFNF